LRAWWQWRPEATTLLTFAAVIGTAIVLDQLPAVLAGQDALSGSTGLYRYLVLSFEEVLELALPVLALLGIVQARWGGNRGAGRSARAALSTPAGS
jgi:hypothetical protein